MISRRDLKRIRAAIARWLTGVLGAILLPAHALGADSVTSISAPVPRAAIYPGSPIRDDQLEELTFRPSIRRAGVHLDRMEVVGKVARRVLLPGRPIPILSLKEAELVSAGQTVTMVYAAGGIEITGRAIALQAGKAGDVVSVRNIGSGLVVHAIVDADGKVLVESR